jgi:hypothetical protein
MKNHRQFRVLTVFFVVTLLNSLSLAFQNNGESGAKALFYDPGSGTVLSLREKKRDPRTGVIKVKRAESLKAKYVGLHYWIELDGVGNVTADRIFHTGDAIRLHIRSNVDGYLSLWAIDTSGQGKLLFPAPGQMNYIKADSEFITPGKIRFSPPVEDEKLLVFFSRSKADGPIVTDKPLNSEVVAQVQNYTGSKALVFETEYKSPAEIGAYVVNKNGGQVVKEIRLKHQ